MLGTQATMPGKSRWAPKLQQPIEPAPFASRIRNYSFNFRIDRAVVPVRTPALKAKRTQSPQIEGPTMNEPKLSTSGLRFIQNPLVGYRDLGITYGPGEPDYRPPPRGVPEFHWSPTERKSVLARSTQRTAAKRFAMATRWHV
jgi:hypothetical protein